MIGTGLTAVYFLLLVNRTFFGRLRTSFVAPPIQWFDRTIAYFSYLDRHSGLWLVRWSETTTALMPTRSS